MSTPELETLQLVGYREPDYTSEPDGRGGLTGIELPGSYVVGFVKDGAFIRLDTIKMGVVTDRIAAAKQQADAQQQQSTQQPATQQPATQQQ